MASPDTIPCSCCDGEATHRGADGFYRCERHRLTADLAPFEVAVVESLRAQLDQCVLEREALAKSYRETVDDRDELLRIINDAFLSLHIPGSTKAFDGRNLVVHAKDSADVAMVLRGERDAARRDLASLMAAAKSLTEDPNACWEDFLAAVDAIARAQSGQPAHHNECACEDCLQRDDDGTASGGGVS